jgi:hypothetical protein
MSQQDKITKDKVREYFSNYKKEQTILLNKQLNARPDDTIDFTREDDEIINKILLLNNKVNLLEHKEYQNIFNMLKYLVENINNQEDIPNIGNVFYLDQSEYNTLYNQHKVCFQNIAEYELKDTEKYNINGKDIDGNKLSIDSIKYSFIDDSINTEKSRLKKIRDIIVEPDRPIEISVIIPTI